MTLNCVMTWEIFSQLSEYEFVRDIEKAEPNGAKSGLNRPLTARSNLHRRPESALYSLRYTLETS